MDKIFNTIFTESTIGVGKYCLCLCFSIIMGIIYLIAYKIRNKTSKTMESALVILPPIISTLIIMVNGNLGVGVAVAGAFSLVRFRSAQGSAKDICLIFMTMCTGLIVGVGYLGYAFIFTVTMSVLVIVVNFIIFQNKNERSKKILKITIPEDLDYTNVFDEILKKYTSKYELINFKTTNLGSLFKLTYQVYLNDIKKEKEMVDELRIRNGNLEIVINNDIATSEL